MLDRRSQSKGEEKRGWPYTERDVRWIKVLSKISLTFVDRDVVF